MTRPNLDTEGLDAQKWAELRAMGGPRPPGERPEISRDKDGRVTWTYRPQWFGRAEPSAPPDWIDATDEQRERA